MHGYYRAATAAINFIIFSVVIAFPMAGKVEMAPMKPAENLSVPSGEFLHYIQYIGGEKNMDIYFVSIIPPEGGEAFVYEEGIRVSRPKKLPDSYTNYNMFFRIDLKSATLLESSGGYGTNREENAPAGYKGLVEWNYRLNPENGWIDYENKNWNGYEIKSRRSRIKTRPGFPAWDSISGSFFALRFMETGKSGIFFFVVPEILKEPIPVSLVSMGHETLHTLSGDFHTVKIGLLSTDPFLGRLMEPYRKEMLFWVEDSPRRLLVRLKNTVSMIEIAGISNISALKKK